MRYHNDHRIVMTLDAGGTNFVFCAVQDEEEIIMPISLPAYGENLTQVLQTIITGFSEVKSMLESNPVAISFAFPGPAEYELGIIGNLENLPTFRGGVALGDMLEEKLRIRLISPCAELSPKNKFSRETIPPPKPVPKVAPNRLR